LTQRSERTREFLDACFEGVDPLGGRGRGFLPRCRSLLARGRFCGPRRGFALHRFLGRFLHFFHFLCHCRLPFSLPVTSRFSKYLTPFAAPGK
jgi:hypothetical protein